MVYQNSYVHRLVTVILLFLIYLKKKSLRSNQTKFSEKSHVYLTFPQNVKTVGLCTIIFYY